VLTLHPLIALSIDTRQDFPIPDKFQHKLSYLARRIHEPIAVRLLGAYLVLGDGAPLPKPDVNGHGEERTTKVTRIEDDCISRC
jgi:hypothetical protein